MKTLERWFASHGWSPFAYQRQTWQAYLRGESGLVHAPTGMGKTYAVFGGPLLEYVQTHGEKQAKTKQIAPHTVLWVTPLRALAHDTQASLLEPVEAIGLPWSVELRTGDTSSSAKARQRKRLPTVLITTPESLSILLSYADARQCFATLQCVIVDEWHELLSTKRGVQAELALARLRQWNPQLRAWGLSATLGNLEEARDCLLGCADDKVSPGKLIHGKLPKAVEVQTLMPRTIERFPWAGHMGVKLLQQVIETIEEAKTSLLFTNTRSQAELWYQKIILKRPDLIGAVAIHHGSLDRAVRNEVEDLIRAGRLKAVVCTSSLDLGVDFSPVDQVLQLGSPKGVARLMQRAGRSGHQPGAISRVLGVPTHAFELIEFSAAREAIDQRRIEARPPLRKPLDVLAQHVITLACGEGFVPRELFDEVRTTHAYRDLTGQEWRWTLAFAEHGGETLRAYPQYARICLCDGRYTASSAPHAKQHRMTIGTITSDTAMLIKFRNGKTLGSIEESFVARLKPGDRFLFSGRVLELLRVRQMVAQVKPARQKKGAVPRWGGTRFPLSTHLAELVRQRMEEAQQGKFVDGPMRLIEPLLALQQRWSRLPRRDELLIERTKTREGHHAFVYPFAGRLAHEGLASLLAYRLTQQSPRSLVINANDYGIELLCPDPLELGEADWRSALSTDELLEHLLACLDATQLARRAFREIARVAGLIQVGFPGERRPSRHLQASSDMLFDVFNEFDPHNLLLDQARREVLDQQLEVQRLRDAMQKLDKMKLVIAETEKISPLAFPLWADRLREEHVSTESWQQRIERHAAELEAYADGA